MKKVFYLIALAIAAIAPQTASADPDLSLYELDWSITDLESSDGTLAIGDSTGTTAYETGNKRQQSLYYCTSPEEFVDHVAFQAVMGSKGWTIRSGYGMWSYAAQRSAAIVNLTKGQLVQIVCSQTASSVITLTNADGDPDGDYTYVLSDDGLSYFITMTEDGQAGFCGAKSVGYITDIYCYNLNADVATATYTIKYVDENGDSIKADRVAEGVVGDTIAVLSTDIASFYSEDGSKKYIYASDNSGENITIAEDSSAVVTITFREAGIYSYSYTAVDASGNTLQVLASGSGFEADAVSVFYPEYFKTDSTLWYKGATSKQFYIDYTLTADGQSGTIAYTDAAITNCILLVEGEDIEGASACTGNCVVRSSMGGAGYFTSDVTLTTLSAGTYTINAVLCGSGSSYASYTQPIIVGDTTVNFACSVVNYEAFSATVTLDESGDLIIGAADLAGVLYGIDYLYVTTDDGGIYTDESEEDSNDGTTGISTVNAEVNANAATIYTLSGVKVNATNLTKGIYIQNGKKFVVK